MHTRSGFGDRLKGLMQEHDIKSETLSKKIGITGSVIRRWTYNGTMPFLSSLIKLADYFRCTIEYLVGRSGNPVDVEPKICPPFAQRVRDVIKAKGITTYELNANTKIKYVYFHRWDNGADPLLSSLIVLADYLDITLDHLVGREG